MTQFSPDPALEPVQAAKDFMAAQQTAQQKAPAVAYAPQRQRPVITPASPMDWSVVVPLRYPLIVDGVTVTELTLRRLTARELTSIIMQDDNEESINLRARAAIAGIHPDVMAALDADDGVEVADAVRPFLPRVLQGAETLELDILASVASRGNGAG